jgi:hypothetical protein
MRFSLPITLLTGALFSGLAIASEEDAESCLTDKIWAGYGDGWAV